MTLRVINGKIVDTDAPKASVRFFEEAKKVGIGQYVPIDFIHVKPVGARDSVSRPATARDKQDYPEEWAAYQAGLELDNSRTTPLNMLSSSKSHFVLELNDRSIHTVEELAFQDECPIAGAEMMWKQAKAYVKSMDALEGEKDGSIVQAHG